MQLLHDYLLYLAQFFLNCLGGIEQHLSALSCMRDPFQRRQTGQIKSNHSTLLKNHIFIYHSLVIRHSNALPIVF